MSASRTLRTSFALPELVGTHRFTVHQYHQLAEIGVLEEGEGVELLDGYVVKKGGSRPSHLRPVGRPGWSALRRFTVPEYHAMIAAGVLADGDPVELIDGYLVQKMSRNPPHDAAMDLFRAAFAAFVPPGTILRSQQAVTLLESEPEPDFALVRGTPRAFAARHPRPAEIHLVVEMADSSLDTDRGSKRVAYARNRLPVYWIVNITNGRVEVYTDPDSAATPPTYNTEAFYSPGQDVPLVIGGAVVGTVAVADLLP